MSKSTYPEYYGQKRWSVTHPRYGTVTVTAPDETAAMFAAARLWLTNWTAYAFYSAAEVTRC